MKLQFWKKKSDGAHLSAAYNLYDSIENLPIWNWNKIQEKGDYTYLRINRINGQITKKEFAILQKTWEVIFSEYIEKFHWSDNFLMIHEKKKEISYLQHQMIITGDRSICTFVEIAKQELELLKQGNDGGFDFWDLKTQMEIQMKMQIDTKKIMVIEFFSYLKSLNSQKTN